VSYLVVDLSNLSDVQAAITTLSGVLGNPANPSQAPATVAQSPVAQAAAQLRRKKIWPFLSRAATVNATEYSLAELGNMLGLSTSKVCSLKAILAKPEQRLGVQFFELAPSGALDAAGNPRYHMPEAVRQAIMTA
jgi:hypothetical protein